MSKFDYMNFIGGGDGIEFVAHAKKFTKEQAIELIVAENDWLFEGKYKKYRKPTVDDVKSRFVRWYVRVPDFCDFDTEGGCYTYCGKDERGSFPVWVINFEELEVPNHA